MSTLPPEPDFPYFVRSIRPSASLTLPLQLETVDGAQRDSARALVDCGATTEFMNDAFVRSRGFPTRKLDRPVPVYNVDGTLNDSGSIREVTDLLVRIGNHSERITFAVCALGSINIILGFTWLKYHNPDIDWREGSVRLSRCPSACAPPSAVSPSAVRSAEAVATAQAAVPLPSVETRAVPQREELKSLPFCESAPKSVLRSRPSSSPQAKPRPVVRFLVGKKTNQGLANASPPMPPENASLMKRWARSRHAAPKAVPNTDPLPAVDPEDEDDEDVDENEDDEDDEWEEGHRVFVAFQPPDGEHVRASTTKSQEFAQKHGMDTAPPTEVPAEYAEFASVFDKESFDELPPQRAWDHAIELAPDKDLPTRTKVYPLSPAEQKELDAFIAENLASNRIRPSKSPMAAPVFFVKKKDGSLRLVQDYRKLNAVTIKNSYPLPLIEELVNKLQKARFFTKFDVRWGYNNVRIREGDEYKAAFTTNRGLFEPLVMFFGLTNSPSTFQTMMNDLFRDLIAEGKLVIYMDDILIFAETREALRETTAEVLRILALNKLYLRLAKCTFEQEWIDYLGLIIGHGTVRMDPAKVAGVAAWPAPRNVHEVQQFLGFANFYRRFVRDYSRLARPMHDLTSKKADWTWGEREQGAFDFIKSSIVSEPILILPDVTRPFRLEADSSDFATGSILSQISSVDGKLHPVAFFSKSLSPAERNYEIHDKELLSIVRSLEEWRHFLEGADTPVEIWTDHANLIYFTKAQRLNRRQARWALYLTRFLYTLHHKPGTSMGKADALSRRADHFEGVQFDNSDVVLLKPEHIRALIAERGHLPADAFAEVILDDIRASHDFDDAVTRGVEALHELQRLGRPSEMWEEGEGLIFYRGKIYVPLDGELRRRVVQGHHDSIPAGHPGRWRTYELVARNYWWPGMVKFIAAYVSGCDLCNRTKIFPQRPAGNLMPNPVPTRRWEHASCDLIVGLPESRGYNAIWVGVDRLGKRVHIERTTNEVNSEGVADIWLRRVWSQHGLSDGIWTDRGSNFVSEFMKALYKRLGISMRASTAYHPQTDGQTERFNMEIEQFLRIFCAERQDDWADLLPLVEFALNNRFNVSTQQTAFFLAHGEHPRMGFEPIRPGKIEAADVFASRMEDTLDEARAAMQKATDDMTRYYNAHRDGSVSYKVGDKVWLNGKNITTQRPTKKLDDKWYGPYPITQVISKNAYKVTLPKSWGRTHPVFNVSLLRLFVPDTITGRVQPPPPEPIVVGGEEEYFVEKVLNSKFKDGKLELLVKWRGYTRDNNSWEPDEFVGDTVFARNYFRLNPDAPGWAPERCNRISFASPAFFGPSGFMRRDAAS